MTRQIKQLSQREFQEHRAKWYEAHFTRRAAAVTLEHEAPALAAIYRHITECMPDRPILGVIGNPEHPFREILPGQRAIWQPREMFIMAAKYPDVELDFNMVSPWYWSEEGWSEFQRLWASLPELVGVVPIPVGTTLDNREVVPIPRGRNTKPR